MISEDGSDIAPAMDDTNDFNRIVADPIEDHIGRGASGDQNMASLGLDMSSTRSRDNLFHVELPALPRIE